MYRKERFDRITAIAEARGFVTVKTLTNELHYSTATVNRDLNILSQMGRIRRTAGGVEPIKTRGIPLPYRYEKMKPEKKRIARVAASYIKDGDTVFIDGSTTCQYMGEYLLEKKDITVVTNNIALAAFLSESGVSVTVIGGKVVEPPAMLSGDLAVENAMHLSVDKFFFSPGCMSSDGNVCALGTTYVLLDIVLAERAKETFLLVDHDKIDVPHKRVMFDCAAVKYVISDYEFNTATQERYKDTVFITVGE